VTEIEIISGSPVEDVTMVTVRTDVMTVVTTDLVVVMVAMVVTGGGLVTTRSVELVQ